MSTTKAKEMTLALLESRAPDATLCPSDVARALANSQDASNEDWRDKMPDVHAAVDELVRDGRVLISWKGRRLSMRRGPYRIQRSAER